MKSLKQLLLGLLSVSLVGGLAYALTCGSGNEIYQRATVADAEIYCIDQSGNFISSGSFTANGDFTSEDDLISQDDLDIADDADIDGEAIIGEGIKLGDATTPTAVPTTANGSSFGLKIPVYNDGAGTIAAGSLLVVSTATAASAFPGYVTTSAALSTTTWMGIADAAITSGAYGWAVVSGYAAALTTGTVAIGSQLISTNSASGYLGAITPADSVFEGAVVGIAASSGTAAGGLTLIRIGR